MKLLHHTVATFCSNSSGTEANYIEPNDVLASSVLFYVGALFLSVAAALKMQLATSSTVKHWCTRQMATFASK